MEIAMQIEKPNGAVAWTPEQRRFRLIGVTAALVVGVLELLGMIVYQSLTGQEIFMGGVYGTSSMIPVWIAVMSIIFAFVVKRGAPSPKQEQMMKTSIILLIVLMASGAGLAVFLGIF